MSRDYLAQRKWHGGVWWGAVARILGITAALCQHTRLPLGCSGSEAQRGGLGCPWEPGGPGTPVN